MQGVILIKLGFMCSRGEVAGWGASETFKGIFASVRDGCCEH